MKKRSLIYSGIIILGTLLITFFDLPATTQKAIIPFTPQAILENHIHLGLDLQGGAQLDYKIDLQKIPEDRQNEVVSGILGIMNKRVNTLGVAEPNIYTSDIGDEKHIIVELAGVKDLETAKEAVGKTIQLEFKEQKTAEELQDPNLEGEVKAQTQSLLDKVLAGGDIRILGQEAKFSNPSRVTYIESPEFVFKDELNDNIRNALFELEAGQTLNRIVDSAGNITINEAGEFVSGPLGFHIIHATETREKERTIDSPRSVQVSHILVAYAGAERAAPEITRTDAEAKARAEEALAKVKNNGDFAGLVKEYSDDTGSRENGGTLETPVSENSTLYVKEFQDAAIAFTEPGQTSEIVKSPFGYHILKSGQINDAKTEVRTEKQVKFIDVYFSAAPDPWKSTELNGQHFVRANTEFSQTGQPYVSILFDDEGGKMFEELTQKNIGKQIAIFVGGELISQPTVNEVIAGGQAQISGQFTVDSAAELAGDLNTGALPAPITLAGQHSIGASLGQESLEKSLNAGIIGIMLVALFMILYYRLPGLLSVIALGAYSAILIFAIKIQMGLALALAVSTILFAYLILRILANRESGAEKAVSAVLACFILFFLSFVLATPIVLTLAGIAGVILSIGMAVDANILIFERIKEELADGRPLAAAIETGFDRAWSSIRDSNFSSLITCGILFYFGSSIIQGFAFNLAAGILISMFTAITITKTFLIAAAQSKLGNNLWLFNKPKPKEKKVLPIIQNRKKLYWVSGIILVISLLGLPFFGLKAGLDFTGGTLMELDFEQEVSADQIREILATENQINNPHIVATENGYLLKIPHITNEQHDQLLAKFKEKLGNLEEIRFSTVGPTVGESLKQRALLAIALATGMIILYIAFAFRRVPRSIGKWRFGLTAVIALIHDLAIMVGVYIYLGAIFGIEIDALFITAMLTVLGFSVHDTIVVFDRIREKLKHQKRDETFADIANQALNDTMARSINTSLSTIIVLATMAMFGGESIRSFVVALLIGIISGTYSSIFVATPLLVDWVNKKQRQ